MNLQFGDLPLRTLFLDFNSFFASVEQQEQPELRNRPMIVASVDADTTFAIAASYEAKQLGIKTGTMVRDAKAKCPELKIALARPRIYKAYHEAIREVAQTVLPEEKVHSIDEMSYRLIGNERDPVEAEKIALQMKSNLLKRIGSCMTCSIGIAPNTFLAKIATEIEKRNGLVILQAKDLPGRMLGLNLMDLTGINVKMTKRLNAAGIFTVQGLYSASRKDLGVGFGSIVGERWWYLLRGFPLPEVETKRKSLSHSNVLAPSLRNEKGCYEVLLRLIQKAAARLRSEQILTGHIEIQVSSFDRSWTAEMAVDATSDTVRLDDSFRQLWLNRNFNRPRKVSVTFSKLSQSHEVTPSLFDDGNDRDRFNSAVDEVNQKFGKNKVFIAAMHQAKDSATEKIAFNKTWLLSEGKDDNDWSEKFLNIVTEE